MQLPLPTPLLYVHLYGYLFSPYCRIHFHLPLPKTHPNLFQHRTTIERHLTIVCLLFRRRPEGSHALDGHPDRMRSSHLFLCLSVPFSKGRPHPQGGLYHLLRSSFRGRRKPRLAELVIVVVAVILLAKPAATLQH